MRQISKPLPITLLAIFISFFYICFAQEHNSFQGRVNTDNINIRCDSTVSSEIIYKVNKNERLEIISESYDWYKIRLPKSAPSFIKKDLVSPIDEKSAKAIKDNVNIRIKADESSSIVGKAQKNEVVSILRDRGDWYKIEPVNNSFGWIYKKFIDKLPAGDKVGAPQFINKSKEENKTISEIPALEENVTIEGTIKPKVIKQVATHKLVAQDNKVFLLRGDKEKLNSFNYRKVKVIGKLTAPDKQKYSILEIEKIEALN